MKNTASNQKMKIKSIQIARVLGIPIYLHFSLLFILPLLAWSFGNNLSSMAEVTPIPASRLVFSPYIWGFFIAVALFASVTLHELGHSIVALRQKIHISGITLMLFGGVAQLDTMPRKPGNEAKIAIAGPLVSILLGVAFILGSSRISAARFPNLAFSLTYLGIINFTLAAFNLLPAFPMDGGRILRSLLVKKFKFRKATKIAATIGKIFAIFFAIWGIYNGQYMLVLIAVFIFSGASQEDAISAREQATQGTRVWNFMTQPRQIVNPDFPLRQLALPDPKFSIGGILVREENRIVGTLPVELLLNLSPEQIASQNVRDVMDPRISTISREEEIYVALQRMTQNNLYLLLVTENDRLLGTLSGQEILQSLSSKKI
jgi:Zn-dependent protease/predicted transcriptional regulator